MTESWTTWQSQVINGTFALRRLLGQTDHSAVFLTDYPAEAIPNAAIKFVQEMTGAADTQLANWRKAAALTHPNLARILESGQCQQEGRPFLYVVTEYAEESLEEILPHRPLTPEEVRAMLMPVLDALAFLHANQLVQGQLKPSNVLVIDDQVKLASDTIKPTGAAVPGIVRSTVYDAPETASGHQLPVGDMWALGVTIVQALTQHLPSWTDGRPPAAVLPANFPRDFIDVVLRCLHQNPTQRPTPQELKAQLSGESTAPLAVLPEPVVVAPELPPRQESNVSKKPAPKEPVPTPPSLTEPARAEIISRAVADATSRQPVGEKPKRPIAPLVGGAVIGLLVIWGWSHLSQKHANTTPSAAPEVQPAPAAAQQPLPAVAPPHSPPSPPSAPAEPGLPVGVLHQELPTVARSANETIHGHFRVIVRVVVNRSGKVIDETLEDAGPSKYFAKQASTAAREWKFAATDDHATREWLLRFDFGKDQVSAAAEPAAAPPG
jgi:eukaryotic-like serine/threonine-protein kinase